MWKRIELATALLLIAASGRSQKTAPIESAHVAGPRGLEGWTLSYPLPDNGASYPTQLIIARKGRVIRRIEGQPFVWSWIFWNDGRQIAYESGPLHFNLSCNLADVGTQREPTSVDCYHGISKSAPAWEKALEEPDAGIKPSSR